MLKILVDDDDVFVCWLLIVPVVETTNADVFVAPTKELPEIEAATERIKEARMR